MRPSNLLKRDDEAPAPVAGFPPSISLLLHEIEREPVPEKLLTLAVELQAALVKKREDDASASRS